ncbi:SCO5389 family protein [Streptomyces sp. NPDC004752]
MSLDVSPQLLAEAEKGEVREEDFVETVRTSLPYAYDLIARLTAELRGGTAEFADNQTAPPAERERGQLLRALSSDAIRGCLERHFGVALAFQNCHRVAVFRPGARGGAAHTRFTSPRAQLLNQSPELRDC